MTALRNTVILASAGTGKTFALSGHYLRLVLAGCPPERILATTFTRKAAGEILERVLLRLARAALDPAECAKLGTECGPLSLTTAHCRDTLARLVRHLDRVNIGTLDAFFAKVALAFRFESGRAVARVATEAEDADIRDAALLDAIEQLPRDRLLTTMRLLGKGELRAAVLAPLRNRAAELHSVFLAAPAQAWDAIAPRDECLSSGAMDASLSHLSGVALPLTKQGKENKRWRDAVDAAVTAAKGQEWARVLSVGVGNALARNTDEYYSAPISRALRDAYAPLLTHARSILLARLRQDTLATREFMSHFCSRYEHLKRRANIATFDDIPRLLLDADACGDLEHLYFRLDTQIDHLLVDEFQDTSAVQYRLLRQLIDEITQDNEGRRSFFAVGDVKQSLYQWRDATPRLLLELSSRIPNVVHERLDRNYRSSTAVLNTVNRVFESLPTSSILGVDDAGQAAAALWDATFRAHTGLDRLRGYVSLRTAPRTKGTPGATLAKLHAAADRAAELLRRQPSLSIGILFQTRKHIAPTVAALRGRGIAVSREGGNTLTDSPAVALALSAVRFAEHPGDSAAQFHLAHSALAKHLGLAPGLDVPLRAAASALRARFVRAGYARTLSDFLAALDGQCTPAEAARFEQLIDMAGDYDRTASPTLPGFERLVRSSRVQSPSDAPVRVMTIHGAKGLEFDSVILADLDDSLSGRSHNLFAIERESENHGISAVCRHSPIGTLLHPRLAAIALENTTRHLHERLCVLYVAMTRARASLDLIVNTPAPPKSRPSPDQPTFPASFAGLLCEALAPDAPMNADSTLWHDGIESSIVAASGSAGRPVASRGTRPILLQHADRSRVFTLQRRSPSANAHAIGIGGASDRARTSASARGRCFHAWFERVEWLDELTLSAERCREIARPLLGLPAGQDDRRGGRVLARWIDDFLLAVRKPNILDALSKQPAAQRLRSDVLVAHREHRFAVRDTDPDTGVESLLVGQVDRLVLAYRDGAVIAAEIIDFKTDTADADTAPNADRHQSEYSATTIAERHAPQLSAYRRAVATVFGLPVPSVRASLFLVSNDTRIDIA